MYFEKDYIKRLIAAMGDFFRRLGDKLDDAELLHRLNDRCLARCGMTLTAADHLTTQSLCDLLGRDEKVELAALTAFRGDRAVHTREEKTNLRYRALTLLLSMKDDAQVCEAMAEDVDRLMRDVLDVLSPADLLACGAFLRDGGRYDLMDSAVFFLWDTLPASGHTACRHDAERVYRPLMGMTDGALREGGLSRGELEESLMLLGCR